MIRIASSILMILLIAIGVAAWVYSPTSERSAGTHYQVAADHAPIKLEQLDDSQELTFRIDWPPKDPADDRQLKTPPLLKGNLIVQAGSENGHPRLNVRIDIIRPTVEADRKRWNQQLKFPQYDWMARVRVWDRQQKWLWPNLPYLLTAHGIEREQRYGGIDPGKGVDNDFAAVVLKPIGSEASPSDPELITARWHPPTGSPVDKRTIIHHALSHDLSWPIHQGHNDGEIGVWLIYADFLESKPPRSWPDEAEFNGGILAYFSVDWSISDGVVKIGSVKNEIPKRATGVDWERWQKESVVKESTDE